MFCGKYSLCSKKERKLFVCRAVALALILIGIFFLFKKERIESIGATPYIARIKIHGAIEHIESRVESIHKIAKDDNVKGVILHVNSPGGDPFASEALYLALNKVRAKKPLVSVIDGMAASGGYFAALPGEKIFARGTSAAGSIGVIAVTMDYSELLQKIGVKANILRTQPLKAVPMDMEKLSDDGKAYMLSLMKDLDREFCLRVKESRFKEGEMPKNLCDGKVYIGGKAIERKLIDELGGEEEALEWMRRAHKLDAKLEVKDWDLLPQSRHNDIFSFVKAELHDFLQAKVKLAYTIR